MDLLPRMHMMADRNKEKASTVRIDKLVLYMSRGMHACMPACWPKDLQANDRNDHESLRHIQGNLLSWFHFYLTS